MKLAGPGTAIICLLFVSVRAFHYPSTAVGKLSTTRLHAAVITGTRRPRRRDLTESPPVQEEDGGDVDTGGGGKKRWIRVWPVGMGQYGKNKACFLARRREAGQEEGSRFESLPMPLFDAGAVEMVTAAFQKRDQESVSKAAMQWATRHMAVGRGNEKGVFDNLPWASWASEDVKREAFSKFLGRDMIETLCPYGTLIGIIENDLGGLVVDVVVDEEDSPRGPGITFGPVLLITEDPARVAQPRTAVVDCTLDEIVGVALALNRAIAIPEDLFDGTTVPTRSLGLKNGILRMEADVPEGTEERRMDLMAIMDSIKPAWEIKTATDFWSMSGQAKRLCLIKSGAETIPKRRYGEQELELALLPFLDETVRFEARLALAMEAGDEKMVEKLVKSRSERTKVKEELAAALRQGDLQRAQELQDRLEVLTAIRFDITQDEGSYQKDLDQDEWYLRSRRT